MSSGGCDPLPPPSPPRNKGKGTIKGKKRYEIKVLASRGRQPSPAVAASTPSPAANASTPSPAADASIPSPVVVASTPSPSIAPMPSPVVAPTPSPTIAPTPSTSPVVAPTPSPTIAPTPSPSPVVAPTPSPTIAPTPSPTIGVNDTFLQQDEEHMSHVDEVDPLVGGLEMIRPTSGGFYPSKTASKAITWTIKQQFREPWATWGAIPKRERDIFFQRFKRKVTWRPKHENQIMKNFHSKASHKLSEMFREARRYGKRPHWIGESVWNRLLEQWNLPNFPSKYSQAQKNRASDKGGALHTSGNISVHDHAIRMSEEYGRPVHIDEVFQQTHLRKDTGQFVDERSRRTHEDFEARLSQARSESASCVGGSVSTPLDPAEEERLRNRCWYAATDGLKASSSRSHDLEEIQQLRQELRRMSNQFQTFIGAVLQFLPPSAAAAVQNIFQQQGNQQLEDGNQQQQQQEDGNQQQQQDGDEQQEDSSGYNDY